MSTTNNDVPARWVEVARSAVFTRTVAVLLTVAALVPATLSAQNGGATGSILDTSNTPTQLLAEMGLTGLPLEHLHQPVVADSVLSPGGRTFLILSGIALLTHLPRWGVAGYQDLDGDRRQGQRNYVSVALAGAGSAGLVAWAAQRRGAKYSTALAGSALGAAAAMGLVFVTDDGSPPVLLLGLGAGAAAHGGLTMLSLR